jgi:hypothetical protein
MFAVKIAVTWFPKVFALIMIIMMMMIVLSVKAEAEEDEKRCGIFD